MSIVTVFKTGTRRGVEFVLLIFAVAIVAVAYLNVSLATKGETPPSMYTHAAILGALVVGFHIVLRWRAPYADPLLLPLATLLNGLGLVMIYRLDIGRGRDVDSFSSATQLLWSGVAMTIAVLVVIFLKDHRMLRRYTFISMAVGFFLLLLPMAPGLGRELNGSRIWIAVGGYTFQPGEIAKIMLTIFFAGYLVKTRDALSLVGRRILGFPLPRGRDLGPVVVAWMLSIGVLVFQKDLGTSLLFFGLFLAMLYVATERVSWIAIGLTMFTAGALVAWKIFAHVQQRVDMWLDPFSDKSLAISDQVPLGMMGMASGGLLGRGLGDGRPYLTYEANSDMIVTAFGEEIGLVGVFAMLVLYALLAERGLRTAIGCRDGFGKLLAVGLAFSIALQVFVVVGGVTRVIPLTGLTTPFLAQGGSSLLANWVIVAILLRISDQARRPVQDAEVPGPSGHFSSNPQDTQVVSTR